MGSYRTFFLLILAAACGIGSGVFGLFYDGLPTAILLIAFPFVAALLFLSIAHDVVNERVGKTESSSVLTPSSQAANAPRSHQSKAT